MSSTATPQYLLEGASLALEQCGLLLRDANLLYRNRAYSSAVVLAAFAREELGRSTILLEMRREALAGKHFAVADIKKHCVDHPEKQKKGMLSTTIADRNLIQLISQNTPQSEEWRGANANLESLIERERRVTPHRRHKSRMSALYVQPESATVWNRPANISIDFAHEFLRGAVNDYSGRYHDRYISFPNDSVLKHIDPELFAALESWTGRPELPPPEWPEFPT